MNRTLLAEAIGSRVDLLRRARQLKQAGLAAKIGVKPAVLSNLTTGRRTFSPYHLKKLAEVLDTTTDFLISGKGSDQDLAAVRKMRVRRDRHRKHYRMSLLVSVMDRWSAIRRDPGIRRTAMDVAGFLEQAVLGDLLPGAVTEPETGLFPLISPNPFLTDADDSHFIARIYALESWKLRFLDRLLGHLQPRTGPALIVPAGPASGGPASAAPGNEASPPQGAP